MPPAAQPILNGALPKPLTNGTYNHASTEDFQFDSIPDTIEAFRTFLPPTPTHTSTNLPPIKGNNEFIIVLDSPHRENEGDLIISAEKITPSQMSFMIRHSSGLICTPILTSQTLSLDLPQMVEANADPNRTAYTVSVDADHPDTTTGISAYDRALTCRTLASPGASKDSFRRPGHVFPLRAREGGIRERRGHTEAAVEFCRLAGKRPVGVICELVDDGVEGGGGGGKKKAERIGGGMLRRDGCLAFGKKWGLRVCTIEDLVKYVEHEEREQVIGERKV